MPIALLGIGLPGSGKTTVLKPFAAQNGFAYINRDEIREELLGDARDQSQNKDVWEEASRRTKAMLEAGQTVVVDGTFLEEWKRRDMVIFLQESGATQVVGVVADVRFEVAKERNQNRERVVADDVMDWMYEKFTNEPPTLDEGFDALIPLERIAEFGNG